MSEIDLVEQNLTKIKIASQRCHHLKTSLFVVVLNTEDEFSLDKE